MRRKSAAAHLAQEEGGLRPVGVAPALHAPHELVDRLAVLPGRAGEPVQMQLVQHHHDLLLRAQPGARHQSHLQIDAHLDAVALAVERVVEQQHCVLAVVDGGTHVAAPHPVEVHALPDRPAARLDPHLGRRELNRSVHHCRLQSKLPVDSAGLVAVQSGGAGRDLVEAAAGVDAVRGEVAPEVDVVGEVPVQSQLGNARFEGLGSIGTIKDEVDYNWVGASDGLLRHNLHRSVFENQFQRLQITGFSPLAVAGSLLDPPQLAGDLAPPLKEAAHEIARFHLPPHPHQRRFDCFDVSSHQKEQMPGEGGAGKHALQVPAQQQSFLRVVLHIQQVLLFLPQQPTHQLIIMLSARPSSSAPTPPSSPLPARPPPSPALPTPVPSSQTY